MSVLKTLYTTFLDALFPIPPAERWIFDADPSSIFQILPRDAHSPIPEACAIFSYKDERTWRLVWSIKYKKSATAAKLAGYALHRMIDGYASVVPHVIVIPMPISKQRRRERGFNQCELLTKEIKRLDVEKGCALKAAGGAVANRLTIMDDLLIRKRHTSRQTLKDKAGRQASAEGLFALKEQTLRTLKDEAQKRQAQSNAGASLTDLTIIIDDVITTGSTMKEAIRTMRQAGFANTWGLSIAH